MKIILLIFTVLLPCKTNAQSTQDSSLYSNIKYVNGKYEREIECVFQGIGKNPIDGDTQGIASAIKKGSSVKCVDAYHAMHIVLM